MKCFSKDYSAIYDFLYTKKNYNKETKILKKILKKYLPQSKSLLDLGCGTGQYSNLMTKLQLNICEKENLTDYIGNTKISNLVKDLETLNQKYGLYI